MNLERLCPGCMRELKEEETASFCPYCGYNNSQEDEPHRLKPRTLLHEKYVVGKVLGEGGFGITYLGYDTMLEMKVAIKEYYPAGFATRDVKASETITPLTGEKKDFYENGKGKFIKEARTLAKFSTLPGIVSVRDFFEENNTSYIIMEYLEGETLKAYLKRIGGVMAPAMVASMLEPVIKALGEVHKQGIIHRDISPDNIMILPDGAMKLLDFGAAREAGGGEKSVSVMLKPGYAPEEQYRTHGNQGPWTDVYGIAATIYRCLTGHAPAESMERMRQDTLRSPLELGIQIEPWKSGALMKGLSLYAENRFQSMEEFYNAFYLNQFSPVPSPQAASAPPVQAPAFREIAPEGDTPTMPLNMTQPGSPAGQGPSLTPVYPQGVNPAQPQQGTPVGPQYIYGNTQAAQASAKKNKTGLIIGLVSGGVALIAVIVLVLVFALGGSSGGTGGNYVASSGVTVTPTQAPDPTEAPTDIPPEPSDTVVASGDFSGDDSKTIRGQAFADFYTNSYGDRYILLATENGVDCGLQTGEDYYTNHTWYAQLNDGFKIHSIAVYEDTLFLACDAKGLVTSNLSVGGDMPIIRNEDITSFAIAGDKLFYIAKDGEYSSLGALYVSDLDGSNPFFIQNDVHCQYLYSGSADLEQVGDRLYYVADKEFSPKIFSCNLSGGDVQVEYEPSEYLHFEGLTYHGGKFYLPSYDQIYCYDLSSHTLEVAVKNNISTYYPIGFTGDSLLYADNNQEWHCVYDGRDVLVSTLTDLGTNTYDLKLGVTGGDIVALVDYLTFYGVDYEKGQVNGYYEMEGFTNKDVADIGMSNQGTSESLEENSDYRARHTAYIDPSGQYILLKNNQWDNGNFVSTSSNGYTILTTDKISYFLSVGDEVYYTVKENDIYHMYRMSLSGGTPVSVVPGYQPCAFSYYGGYIYFEDYGSDYAMCRFDPDTEQVEILDRDVAIGYSYILNGYIYYEDLYNETIGRMKVDGSGKEVLFDLSDLGISNLKAMAAFNEAGETYFAFLTANGELVLSNRYGTDTILAAEGLEEFDLGQDLYYDNGGVYYMTGNGSKIHRYAVGDYLNNGNAAEIEDYVITSGDFYYIDVTQGIIFAERYDGENEILALDGITGEEYNSFYFEE